MVKGTQIDFDIGGKTVVLCDDVLYTGRTVRAAISAVTALGGKLGREKRIRLLEVIDRDYIGKNVPTSRKEKVFVRFKETDGEDGVFLSDC